MTLISCPECKKEVSDQAQTCPNCGVAISSAKESQAAGARITTIQETSKKLKIHTLISVGVIILGVLIAIGGASSAGAEGENAASGLGAVMFIVGFIWFVATRIRIWWHHG